mmetsp:Transcript_11096/g.68305  ORF Transcript_11096/g.68305 Transcript_11096/m.68305 type:complete len:230 (-) Transcript_11096:1318-2007(-)
MFFVFLFQQASFALLMHALLLDVVQLHASVRDGFQFRVDLQTASQHVGNLAKRLPSGRAFPAASHRPFFRVSTRTHSLRVRCVPRACIPFAHVDRLGPATRVHGGGCVEWRRRRTCARGHVLRHVCAWSGSAPASRMVGRVATRGGCELARGGRDVRLPWWIARDVSNRPSRRHETRLVAVQIRRQRLRLRVGRRARRRVATRRHGRRRTRRTFRQVEACVGAASTLDA